MSDGTRTRGLQSHSLETTSENLGENRESESRSNTGANTGALEAACEPDVADPDLALVVSCWDELPAALRAGIAAMVRAAGT